MTTPTINVSNSDNSPAKAQRTPSMPSVYRRVRKALFFLFLCGFCVPSTSLRTCFAGDTPRIGRAFAAIPLQRWTLLFQPQRETFFFNKHLAAIFALAKLADQSDQ